MIAMIGVYADWNGLYGPKRVGFLHNAPITLSDPALSRVRLVLPDTFV